MRVLIRAFLISASIVLLPLKAPAQTQANLRWWVQASPFVMQYHDDFEYAPGMGLQLALGRQWQSAYAGILKFSCARPAQSFLWLDETHDLQTDWYGFQFGLRAHWPFDPHARFHLFAEVQAGWQYLHPHDLSLPGGTQGTILISLPGAWKFSPAWAGGINYRCLKQVAVFLQTEIGGLKIAPRQLNALPPSPAWKPYSRLGVGAMILF